MAAYPHSLPRDRPRQASFSRLATVGVLVPSLRSDTGPRTVHRGAFMPFFWDPRLARLGGFLVHPNSGLYRRKSTDSYRLESLFGSLYGDGLVPNSGAEPPSMCEVHARSWW